MTGSREQAAALTGRLQERLTDAVADDAAVSRRAVLGGLGLAGATAMGLAGGSRANGSHDDGDSTHGNFGPVGEYRSTAFDPHAYLREFNIGSRRPIASGPSGSTSATTAPAAPNGSGSSISLPRSRRSRSRRG